MTSDTNHPWKIAGVLATLVIVMTIPLYYARHRAPTPGRGAGDSQPASRFVGSEACRDCHRPEYDKWAVSHHRWAMETATAQTVRGDFNDAAVDHFGKPTRFYMRDGKYYVHTQGPGGQPGEFEVTYTFGWYPLQQYLVPFPGGRLQCLPFAWDVEQKRWYHLYPDTPPDPKDWLYWTNNGQNWNGMCAECHSTDLKKNYDFRNDTYATTWSEISVGCEACHGPASAHVKWAQLPEMGRPEAPNAALTVTTRDLTSRQQIELCAPCHSRRMSLDDNIHRHADFLDYGVPQLLDPGLYFADGQILDEVYVYGSFMQSKMYARGVRCSDCHDVHSIRRIKDGNDLCLQCHKAAVYDQKKHHFHKRPGEPGEPIRSPAGEVLFEVGSGARCEACHMPGRTYMGIDYRPDHSFRRPRPDLTLAMGTPNACDRCHVDKATQWSVDAMAKWYGQAWRPHYGQILKAGREQQPEAAAALASLARDRLYPTIVRATALSLLAAYGGETARQAFAAALLDEESLMRQTAVRRLPERDPPQRLKLLAPMLYDPVRAVRIEAAGAVAELRPDTLPADTRRQFDKALAEYRHAMERTADFAASRHNLGNLARSLGHFPEAVDEYRKAIAIDDQFYPAKVNLAMLYNQLGRNDEAQRLLQEVVKRHPDLYELQYSLGLLLAEQNRLAEAAVYLRQAAAGLPQRARIHYNLGLLVQRLNRDNEAEAALQTALVLEPENPDYIYALAVFYLERGRREKARALAEKLMAVNPASPAGRQLLKIIEQNKGD
jgi:tetratricopeptide (TPR) repeat protein